MIPFTYENDEGDEITVQLPSINAVCHDCDGEGVTLNENLRGGFTHEQLHECFDEDESFAEYKKGGHSIYGVTCKTCKGNKVVAELNERACPKDLLKRYRASQREDREYEQLCNMERMMGA